MEYSITEIMLVNKSMGQCNLFANLVEMAKTQYTQGSRLLKKKKPCSLFHFWSWKSSQVTGLALGPGREKFWHIVGEGPLTADKIL